MSKQRIHRKASRTAAMTCLSRAASSLEHNPAYCTHDHLSRRILPRFLRILIHFSLFRTIFFRYVSPPGVYEYVIARTRYIDAAFEQALSDGFDQILLFGAGYDTRALRFQEMTRHTRIFELDTPFTQQAKIRQFKKRHLAIPSNLIFIGMDFEKEGLFERLDQAGFHKGQKNLYILEGVLMYLEPQAVQETFLIMAKFAGSGSRIVFDYIQASVLCQENRLYGAVELFKSVSKSGEPWRFGLEPDEIEAFAASYGFEVLHHLGASELEAASFQNTDGRRVRPVNAAHCLVTLGKP